MHFKLITDLINRISHKFTQVNEQLTLWYVTLYRVIKVEEMQEVVQEMTAYWIVYATEVCLMKTLDMVHRVVDQATNQEWQLAALVQAVCIKISLQRLHGCPVVLLMKYSFRFIGYPTQAPPAYPTQAYQSFPSNNQNPNQRRTA